MELSIIRLQDPAPVSSAGERRRRIRHQLHTPVYASFKGPSTGMVLDLSELLDDGHLLRGGFALQQNDQAQHGDKGDRENDHEHVFFKCTKIHVDK